MKTLIVLGIAGISIWLTVAFPHAMLNPGELVQGHQELHEKCFSCHTPFGGIDNGKCIACHPLSEIGKDPAQVNAGIGRTEKILFHQNLAAQACSSCHIDHQGLNQATSLSTFKHELLVPAVVNNCVSCHAKPTDTLHSKLPPTCINCHNTEGWKLAGSFNHNMLQGTEKNNCVNCHSKPTDELHVQLSANCKSCHSTEGWALTSPFNHDMLVGTEKNNCASCHQNPKDDFHASNKDNCIKCHGTTQWTPSTFDHSAYFQLDGDHNAKCTVCHLNNNFSTYSCYGCHEHSESKVRQEHAEEGIRNFTNCIACHKSGNEQEGGENGNRSKQNNKQQNKSEESEDDDH
jgi:hypothetical protein